MTDALPNPEAEAPDEPFVDYDGRFDDPKVEGMLWRPWWTEFLRAYSTIGTVTDAAKSAGVSPQFARRDAAKHEQFKVRWSEAQDIAADLVRRTIRIRATIGEKVSVTTTTTREELDASGEVLARVTTVAVTEKQEPSNSVLIRVAQALCPEYRPEATIRHGGTPDGVPVQVEVKDRRRTPERVMDLARELLELGIDVGNQEPAEDL